MPMQRFNQGFETNTAGFLQNGSGTTASVASGTGGIISRDGNAHGLITDGGTFTRFDGYRSAFNGGFTTSINVYIDPSWALGEGFEWSVAANGQDGIHQRDFILAVTRDTSTGLLLVGAANGSTFTPNENLESGDHAVITDAGWYTLEHTFAEGEDGSLEVTLSVIDADGDVVFSHLLNQAEDVVATEVGGNRYGWFTTNTVTGGLAIDGASLSTVDTNPFTVHDGNNIVGSYATEEEAIEAAQDGDGSLGVRENGVAGTTYYVTDGDSIQDAIDAAQPGDTIMIAAGSYAGNLTIETDGLTIIAEEGAVLQGTFLTDNGIGDDLIAHLNTNENYGGGAGTAVYVSASDVSISGLTIDGYRIGVDLGDGTDGLTLTDVHVTNTIFGIDKAMTADVSDVTVNGGSFVDVYLGMNIAKDPAEGVGNLDGFTMNGTSFDHMGEKGMYFETLLNALITNITMNDVGAFGRALPFTPTQGGESGSGLELNLKFDEYSNITIDGFTFTNVGQSTGSSGTPHFGAAAIQIKNRTDGGTYGPNPASFDGSVIIRNGSIDGTSVGIRQGEANRNVTGPTLSIENVTILNALVAALENVTTAPMNIVGSGDDDTISFGSISAASTGVITASGGEGYDTLHLADATGDVSVDFNAGTVTFNGRTISIDGIENVTTGAGATLVATFDADNLPEETVELEGTDGFDNIDIQVANLAPGDIIVMDGSGGSIDLDFDGDGIADVSFSGIEEVTLNGQHIVLSGDFSSTGLSNDTIIMNGTAGNDILDGRLMTSTESIEANGFAGNDLIYGAGGDDLLDGGDGTDSIYGGAGNDTFVGNMDGVADTFRGEGGIDTVDYSGATNAMNINLANSAVSANSGTDQLIGIENAIGSDFGDTISGSTADNRLEGGLGNDTLNGNGGIDTVVINADASNGIAVQGASRITVTTADGVDLIRNVEFIEFNNATIQINGVTGNAFAYGVDDTVAVSENGAAATGDVDANDIEIEGEATYIAGVRTGTEAAGGALTVVSGATVIEGTYGTLTINPNGTYSYVVTDESLAEGEAVSDVFTYSVLDGVNEGSLAQLTFNVTGDNDAAVVVTADNEGAVAEDGVLAASGEITFTDADANDVHVVSHVANEDDYIGSFSATLNDAGLVGWDFSVDNEAIQYLAAGQVVTQTYTVQIEDLGGDIVEQEVTITITGENDGPVIAGEAASAAIVEDGMSTSASGSMAFTDVDLTDDHEVSFEAGGEDYLGTFSVTVSDEATGDGEGSIGWDFSVNNAAIQYLGAGEVLTQTYTVTIDDGEGGTSEQDVTITITGTNDAPTVSAIVGEDGNEDDGLYNLNLLDGAADVDQGTVLEVDSVSAASDNEDREFTFTVNDETGAFELDLSQFNDLADGEEEVVTVTYNVVDGDGGSTPNTATFTVTGSNDAPVVSGPNTGGVTEDVDVTPGAPGGAPAGSIITVGESMGNDSFGGATVLNRSDFRVGENADLGDDSLPSLLVAGSNAGEAADYFAITLVAGETLIVDADYVPMGADLHVGLYGPGGEFINDEGHNGPGVGGAGAGGGEEGYLTYVVPTSGTYYIYAYNYGSSSYGLNVSIGDFVGGEASADTLNDSGTVDFSDVDLTDEHTVDFEAGDEGYLGAFTVDIGDDSTGDGTGVVNWQFSVDNDAVQYLREGEVLTQTYSVTVDDGNGGTDTETVTITITGTNDVPVVANFSDEVGENQPIAGTVATGASDVDNDEETLVYALTEDAPTGLTFNPDGTWEFVADGYDYLADGEELELVIGYTATDEDGGESDEGTLTITITGSNDAPVAVASTNEVNEDETVDGQVTATDAEDDFDDEDMDVTTFRVVDEEGNLLDSEDYPEGLTFNNATGEYSFDASSYDDIGADESLDVTFFFVAVDSDGVASEEPQTVTITVNGVNDAPVAGDFDDEVGENQPIAGAVSATDEDSDEETLVYALTDDVPTGLTFNPDGTWEFVADGYDYLQDGEELVLEIGYTATDSGGAESNEGTLTITITGSNDAPVATGSSSSVNEGDSVDGSVTATDAEDDFDGEDDDVTTFLVTDADGNTIDPEDYPEGLSFNTATGEYTFDASSYDLGRGDTEVITFYVVGVDSNDVRSDEPAAVNITINGTGTVVDLEDGGDSYTGDGSDEDITGGNGDDQIFAGGGDNIIDAGDGDDYIVTGGGDDVINGDGDDDVIIAGSGDDVIDGGAGNDQINAGSGNDLVYNTEGDDDLRGGTGNDTVSFERADGPITVDLHDTGFQETGTGNDLIQGFENVVGSDFDDTITGNHLANTLDGGAGDDTMDGGSGDDVLNGGAGVDYLSGGEGVDTVSFAGFSTGVQVNLRDQITWDGSSMDFLTSVENATGSDFGDYIFGSEGNNILLGGDGDDFLFGLGGTDTVDGGEGFDSMYLRGASSEYTVTAVDDGFELVDSVADRDGTIFITSVEALLFNNGSFAPGDLVSEPEPAPVLSSDKGNVAQVLPSLTDDGFFGSFGDSGPLVLPAISAVAFDMDMREDVVILPNAMLQLLPEDGVQHLVGPNDSDWM